MKTVQTIMAEPSPWTGSSLTRSMVRDQIKERWGATEAKRYNPKQNARTFSQWLKLGFVPRKGEKTLRSFTFVEVKGDDGKVTKRIKRTVCLFYYLQVEPKKSV